MASFKYNYITRCNNFLFGYGFNQNLVRYDIDTNTTLLSPSNIVPNTSNVRDNDYVKLCVIDESNVIFLNYSGTDFSRTIHVKQYNFDSGTNVELFTQLNGNAVITALDRRLMYFTYNTKKYVCLISVCSEYGLNHNNGILISVYNMTDDILSEISDYSFTQAWDGFTPSSLTNPQIIGNNIIVGLVPHVESVYGVTIYKLNIDTLGLTSGFIPSTVNYASIVDYSARDVPNNNFYYVHTKYDGTGSTAKIIKVDITDFSYDVVPLTISSYTNVSFLHGKDNFYIQISGDGFYDKGGNSLGITGMTISDYDEINSRFYQRALSGKDIISRDFSDNSYSLTLSSLPNNTLNYCKLVGDIFVIIRYISSESYVVKAT